MAHCRPDQFHPIVPPLSTPFGCCHCGRSGVNPTARQHGLAARPATVARTLIHRSPQPLPRAPRKPWVIRRDAGGSAAATDAVIAPYRIGPLSVFLTNPLKAAVSANAPTVRVYDRGRSCSTAITGTAARATAIVGTDDSTIAQNRDSLGPAEVPDAIMVVLEPMAAGWPPPRALTRLATPAARP